jgi:predicted nuclease of predicted toxin-antitoxin system
MKFKIDENLPIEFAGLLHAAGHDAVTAFDEGLQGAPDADVTAACQQEARVLVTLDLDFSNLTAYPPDRFPGFIVVRPHHQHKHHLIHLMQRVIPLLATEPVEHRLWIVEEARVRIRRTYISRT